MHLRPYNKDRDFTYIKQWVTDSRTHAMWCANLIPYPLSQEGLEATLEAHKEKWGDTAYVFVNDEGIPIGFFSYSVNVEGNFGFLKFVVVDNKLRGQGYGVKMLQQVQEQFFGALDIDFIKLNVFDNNEAARRCYEKAGFKEIVHKPHSFPYEDELWGQCHMSVDRNAN